MKGGGEFVNYYLKLIMLFLSVAVIVTAIILCCVTEGQITDRSATYKKYADGYDSSQYIYTCCTNCQTSTANNYTKYKDPKSGEVTKYYLWIDQYVLEEVIVGGKSTGTYKWKLSTTTSPYYTDKTFTSDSTLKQEIKKIPVYTCDKFDDKNNCTGNKAAVSEIVVLRTIYQSKQISAFDGSTGENQLKLYDECFPNAPSPSYIGDTYETPVAFTDKDGKTTEYSKYNDWLLVNYCDKDSQTRFCDDSKRLPEIPPNSKELEPPNAGIDPKYNKIVVYQSNLTSEVITLEKCHPKWGTIDTGSVKILEISSVEYKNTYNNNETMDGIAKSVSYKWNSEYITSDYKDPGNSDSSVGGKDDYIRGEYSSKDETWVFYPNNPIRACSSNDKGTFSSATGGLDNLCEDYTGNSFQWEEHEVDSSACGTVKDKS